MHGEMWIFETFAADRAILRLEEVHAASNSTISLNCHRFTIATRHGAISTFKEHDTEAGA